MTPQKQIIILVAFSLAGLIFIFQGIYFLSKKYQNALKETQNSEKGKKNSENSAKILGYISLAIGFLTIFCGIIWRSIFWRTRRTPTASATRCLSISAAVKRRKRRALTSKRRCNPAMIWPPACRALWIAAAAT